MISYIFKHILNNSWNFNHIYVLFWPLKNWDFIPIISIWVERSVTVSVKAVKRKQNFLKLPEVSNDGDMYRGRFCSFCIWRGQTSILYQETLIITIILFHTRCLNNFLDIFYHVTKIEWLLLMYKNKIYDNVLFLS